jgi:hypothetical protein
LWWFAAPNSAAFVHELQLAGWLLTKQPSMVLIQL